MCVFLFLIGTVCHTHFRWPTSKISCKQLEALPETQHYLNGAHLPPIICTGLHEIRMRSSESDAAVIKLSQFIFIIFVSSKKLKMAKLQSLRLSIIFFGINIDLLSFAKRAVEIIC